MVLIQLILGYVFGGGNHIYQSYYLNLIQIFNVLCSYMIRVINVFSEEMVLLYIRGRIRF